MEAAAVLHDGVLPVLFGTRVAVVVLPMLKRLADTSKPFAASD